MVQQVLLVLGLFLLGNTETAQRSEARVDAVHRPGLRCHLLYELSAASNQWLCLLGQLTRGQQSGGLPNLCYGEGVAVELNHEACKSGKRFRGQRRSGRMSPDSA